MIFGDWFKRVKEVVPPPIIAGQQWRYKTATDDPWPLTRDFTVTVIDAKKGWVRYKFDGGLLFKDERMKDESFRYCYAPVSHATPVSEPQSKLERAQSHAAAVRARHPEMQVTRLTERGKDE